MSNSKRFLPRKGKNGEGKVSREQVTQAILAFKSKGGLIQKLPPEPSGPRRLVGNRWAAMYEQIFDLA